MLQFLGTGSAFNTELGNNCAFIREGDQLLLFDCGSTTFDRLKKSNLLDGVKNISVIITHMHPDHVGSLGDLIFYSYFSIGEMMKPCLTVHTHKDIEIELFLNLMGVNNSTYFLEEIKSTEVSYINEFGISIIATETKHFKGLKSFSYSLMKDGKSVYYSGDSNDIPEIVLLLFKKNIYDYFYQDTCKLEYEGNVHLPLSKLKELIPMELRDRVYCMHLDETFNKEEAKELGFNVVESII